MGFVGAKAWPVEARFCAFMVAVLLGFSAAYGLPLRLPAADGAAFVGVHYLIPLIGVVCAAGCAAFGCRSDVRPLLTAVFCYAVVLFVHFHLKLWVPLINPHRYDQAYWAIDQQFRPLVDGCRATRKAILPLVPYEMNLYMHGFMLLFYVSFCYHALRTPAVFRTLFLAMLFIQGLGALAYLIMPALGPFVFEQGVNPHITEAQRYMIGVHDQIIAGGADWLSGNQGRVLIAGLGAMPSLHVGSSFVFLWFAARHGRVLLPTYIPLFAYIVINSVASRWHYLMDLPAGLALASFCIWLAHRCTLAPVPEPALAMSPGHLPEAALAT